MEFDLIRSQPPLGLDRISKLRAEASAAQDEFFPDEPEWEYAALHTYALVFHEVAQGGNADLVRTQLHYIRSMQSQGLQSDHATAEADLAQARLKWILARFDNSIGEMDEVLSHLDAAEDLSDGRPALQAEIALFRARALLDIATASGDTAKSLEMIDRVRTDLIAHASQADGPTGLAAALYETLANARMEYAYRIGDNAERRKELQRLIADATTAADMFGDHLPQRRDAMHALAESATGLIAAIDAG